MTFQIVNACRSCGAKPLTPILSLGETPLANSLPLPDAGVPEPRFPLDLVLCEACSLVQITCTVPPETLFRDYVYFSSYSDTMLAHAQDIAETLIRTRHLNEQSLAAEIASNDGYLLQFFKQHGVPVLGIDPARNVARVAEERGVRTIPEFWSTALAHSLAGGGERADVLLANNVMAHVPDINGIVEGVRVFLKPNGLFVMETPYVGAMLDGLEFDTIYHEHLFYYSLTALQALFARHALDVVDVQQVAIHGGSLRVSVAHAGAQMPTPAVAALRAEEDRWGAARPEAYRAFAGRIGVLREQLRALLADYKRQGKTLAAYGASAKGNTLLHAFGIGPETLDFVADRSAAKQGRTTPGTHLPIVAPEALTEKMPDAVLLLTWNFADEILAQQAEYRRRGGQFIIPIPTLRVV